MEEMKIEALMTLLSKSKESGDGVYMIDDDNAIIDYVTDVHGHKLLSTFQNSERNTGVSMMFHHNDSKKDLILIFSTKNQDGGEKNNGLVCFVTEAIYDNPAGIEKLIEIMKMTFKDDYILSNSVVNAIQEFVLMSIDLNASEKNN